MALEKTTKEDKIEVIDAGDWKMVQVRTATIITEDGTELNRSFSRHVVSPADDWSSASAKLITPSLEEPLLMVNPASPLFSKINSSEALPTVEAPLDAVSI